MITGKPTNAYDAFYVEVTSDVQDTYTRSYKVDKDHGSRETCREIILAKSIRRFVL